MTKTKEVCGIVAFCFQSRGISSKGTLPWKDEPWAKEDLHFFQKETTKTKDPTKLNAVIMGMNTWTSLPNKPLKNRLNVILTRKRGLPDEPGVWYRSNPDKTMQELVDEPLIETIFVIGGAEIYHALEPWIQRLNVTEIQEEYPNMDVLFPVNLTNYRLMDDPAIDSTGKLIRKQYVKNPHEEQQYLDLIRKILAEGTVKGDRTGVGTKSIFGASMRFNLRNGRMPLLTTKRTYWKAILVELFWFLGGQTNNKLLQDQGVHIWDGNSSRAFLDKLGYPKRDEGDCGPVYGFQWRHFGATYVDCKTDYTGQGVDQLKWLVNEIRTNPNSRRLILNAWNPVDLPQMVLPPCHVLAQFNVADGELSCQLYQRSADVGLGVPFNIASYALLTHLIAHCCGLKTGELIHVLGDAHVYLNHVEALKEQLTRTPKAFPTIQIASTASKEMDAIQSKDVELVGYQSHPGLKMEMAV